jgi:hypothetical protein
MKRYWLNQMTGGGSLRIGWVLLPTNTHEIILKHFDKRKKATVIRMSGPGFQLTAVWFPEEQAAD